MFQFNLDQPQGGLFDADPLDPDEVAPRLRLLHELVKKLCAAGWPVWFTVGGVGFSAPDDCEDVDEVEQRLADLGITEPFEDT